MSTVGTLYDETVKNGYADFLQAINVGTAGAVGFSLPAGYDSYLFDLDALYFTLDNAFLIARVSVDNGASYKADSYWWSATTIWSNQPNPTVSQYGSVVLGGGHTTWLFLTHGNWLGHPAMGRVKVQPTNNVSNVLWKTGTLQNGNYNAAHVGSGWWASAPIINAMMFLPGNGGTFNGGTIRLFGLKNGA
jgi:hypothetical protein